MAKTSIHIKPANLGAGGHGSTNAERHAFRLDWYMKAISEHPKAEGHFELVADSSHNEEERNKHYYPGGLSALYERDKREAAAHSRTGKAPSTKKRTRVNAKTGRAYEVESWTPIREGVAVIKPETKIKDFKPFIDWLWSKGIGVIAITIHRDEGHIDSKTGEIKINNHAHLLLDYMNHATGKTIKLSKAEIKEMQTRLAASLGMERGDSKDITKRSHIEANEFRARKLAEEIGQLEREKEEARQERDDMRQAAREGLAAKAASMFGAGELAKARKRAEEAETEARKEKERADKEEAEKRAYFKEASKWKGEAAKLSEALQKSKYEATQAREKGLAKGLRLMAEAIEPERAAIALIMIQEEGTSVPLKLWNEYRCQEIKGLMKNGNFPKIG